MQKRKNRRLKGDPRLSFCDDIENGSDEDDFEKRFIGSLPEIVGDQSHAAMVAELEKLLQEDSEIVVTVLDVLSDLNLNELQEQVALAAGFNTGSGGSSVANELLMVVRKQVSNPDMKYRRMGIIGVLRIVSTIASTGVNAAVNTPSAYVMSDLMGIPSYAQVNASTHLSTTIITNLLLKLFKHLEYLMYKPSIMTNL